MKLRKSRNISQDCYEFVLERIDREFFKEQENLTIGNKFLSSWLWLLLITPLLATTITLLIYIFILNMNTDRLIEIFLTGQVVIAILAGQGIQYATTKTNRFRNIRITLVVSIILFSPWHFAGKFRELGVSSFAGISNIFIMAIALGIVFILICLVVIGLVKTYLLFSEILNLFTPVIPATLGRFSPNTKTKMDKILQDEVGEYSSHTREYHAITVQAQAFIDSANVLILPWVTLLAIISIATKYASALFSIFTIETSIWSKYIKSLENFINIEGYLQILIVTVGILAVFNIAKYVFVNAVIIQSVARLSLRD